MKLIPFLASLLLVATGHAGATEPGGGPAPAQAGDSYTNPILFSDYSDPDVIRVGGDYWMTASSFTCYPGLQILHSTNLVDWEIVNAAVPYLEPAEEFDTPSHGNGIWAPCIRHHDGRFWIFWGDPDYGIFQIHADDPRGEWSRPQLVIAGKGLIDPSPLWDDDGRVYLVHSWAGSRAGFKSVLSVCELDSACTRAISDQILVFDGKKHGNETVEGPKFYKRDGWYYIFAPSGGVKEGWQLVLRSKNVYGPYEWRNVLHQGDTEINGPHQGGWVTDVEGGDWFIHFQDKGPWGRICHLQPMSWSDDGWCIMGEDIDGDGIGEPVRKWKMPASDPGARMFGGVSALATTTGFTRTSIPLNWQWAANPKFWWYMPNPELGCLRLNCIKNPEGWRNLRDTPNILAQKIVGPETEFTTRLVFRPSYAGDRTGVIVTGRDYGTIELYYDGTTVFLQRRDCIGAENGDPEKVSASEKLGESQGKGKPEYTDIYIKVKVDGDCVCTFSWSPDGRRFRQFGPEFKAREGEWIGAKIGYFATAEIQKNDGGSVEVY